MKSLQTQKPTPTEISELDNKIRETLNKILVTSLDKISTALKECNNEECIEELNIIFKDLDNDINYIMNLSNERKASILLDMAKASGYIIQFLKNYDLLNTDYKTFVGKIMIKDGDEHQEAIEKAYRLFSMLGSILINAACRARYKGVSKIGNYELDKYLLLLGLALDNMTLETEKQLELSPYYLTAAFLVLYGKDQTANEVLARAGLSLKNIDNYLRACSYFAKLYDIGIRFTEEDLE